MADKTAKNKSTSPAVDKKKKPIKLDSPRWVAPLMIALFVIGLLWVVVYYIAPQAPLIESLGAWNVAIGFALIGFGFVVSTKWK